MKQFYSGNHQNSYIKGGFSLHSDSQNKIAPTVFLPCTTKTKVEANDATFRK